MRQSKDPRLLRLRIVLEAGRRGVKPAVRTFRTAVQTVRTWVGRFDGRSSWPAASSRTFRRTTWTSPRSSVKRTTARSLWGVGSPKTTAPSREYDRRRGRRVARFLPGQHRFQADMETVHSLMETELYRERFLDRENFLQQARGRIRRFPTMPGPIRARSTRRRGSWCGKRTRPRGRRCYTCPRSISRISIGNASPLPRG